MDSKPEATREAELRNIRQMAASVLKSGTSGEVQTGLPEDRTCFIFVPEKNSGMVCFQAMPASSQDVRAKTTPVALTDSAEYFHDGFRGLIENSLQGILIHRDWQPIFANDALARIFGYPEANAILELNNVRELHAEHERDRLKMFNETRLAGGEVPEIYGFEALRADGISIWIQMTVRVVNWKGERAGNATLVHRRYGTQESWTTPCAIVQLRRLNRIGDQGCVPKRAASINCASWADGRHRCAHSTRSR